MTSVILQLLFGAACIGVGFAAGLCAGWREYRLGSKTVTAPTLPRTDRQQAYVLMIVGALALASTAYAGMQAVSQAQCNREFRESLVARSAISTENTQHLNDMIGVIADASANPQPGSRERTQKAVLDYREWAITADQRRVENPIGDPVCGGT